MIEIIDFLYGLFLIIAMICLMALIIAIVVMFFKEIWDESHNKRQGTLLGRGNTMKFFSTTVKKELNSMDHRKVSYVCAKCNKTIGSDLTGKFCPHCGRRIKYE